MGKRRFKQEIKELIKMGTEESMSNIALVYFMEAISKLMYYEAFNEMYEVTENDPFSEDTNI